MPETISREDFAELLDEEIKRCLAKNSEEQPSG